MTDAERKELVFKAIETSFAGLADAATGGAEVVAIVSRSDGGACTIVSNLGGIEATIEQLRGALEKCELVKKQLDAGVAHIGEAPPSLQ